MVQIVEVWIFCKLVCLVGVCQFSVVNQDDHIVCQMAIEMYTLLLPLDSLSGGAREKAQL